MLVSMVNGMEVRSGPKRGTIVYNLLILSFETCFVVLWAEHEALKIEFYVGKCTLKGEIY